MSMDRIAELGAEYVTKPVAPAHPWATKPTTTRTQAAKITVIRPATFIVSLKPKEKTGLHRRTFQRLEGDFYCDHVTENDVKSEALAAVRQ